MPLDALYTEQIQTGLSLTDLKFLAWQWDMDSSKNRELMIPARLDIALRYKEVDVDTQVLQQLLLVSSPFEEKFFRTRMIQNILLCITSSKEHACCILH
jgi:hypothetical protein